MKGPTQIILNKKIGLSLADALCFALLTGMMVWVLFFKD